MKIRHVLDRLDEISRRDVLKGAGAAAVGGLASKDINAEWKANKDWSYLANESRENPSVILVRDENSELGHGIFLLNVPIPSIFRLKFPRQKTFKIKLGLSNLQFDGIFLYPRLDSRKIPVSVFVLANSKYNWNKNLLEIFWNTPGILGKDIKISCTDFEEVVYTFPGIEMPNTEKPKSDQQNKTPRRIGT